MSTFDFAYELSPGEISDCVQTVGEMAVEVFGPIKPITFKSVTETLTATGSYARFSRLVIAESSVISSVVIEGTVFTPSGDWREEEDDDGEPIRVWAGSVFDFETDSADQSMNVSHHLGTLTVNAIGDIEVDLSETIDEKNPDPVSIGPPPTLTDQFALSDIRAIFLA